ncbi:MAG: succinate dehydrogenase [Planctomycetota bacterium]
MADVTAEAAGWADRYHFLIRRLHSLSGIVPVGVFLCIHMSVNATIVAGPQAFQFGVDRIHALDQLGVLTAVEMIFIFIPIAFHAIVGIQIWLSGKSNVLAYQHGGNVRYALQRWTGLVALPFILIHLWHMHWLGKPFGGAEFDPYNAAYTAVKAIQVSWWYTPFYAVGVLASVYHLANGIWTFLITWGITIGPQAQRRSGYVCVVIGLLLGLLGIGSLLKLKTTDLKTLRGSEAAETFTADAGAVFGDTIL